MTLFAHPMALWLMAVVPVLGLMTILAWYRRRQALACLGNVPAMQGLLRVRRGPRVWRGLCFFAGLIILIVGSAGPQWGREPSPLAAASGRDLVVVLDLSRSMLAEQPSRQERALRALRDLADSLQQHGGHRVALVIFAGRPQVVFPLTSDYDHFRAVLATLDADNLPPELRPDPDDGAASGTRIGAALSLAVQTHEPRFQAAQDILLLSDGDDPAGDDEWSTGAEAARKQKIPVHAIGVGDPDRDSPIPYRDDVLRHGDAVVKTRLHEKPLQEIARRTNGIYLPAQTKSLPLGKLFREAIEPRGQRQASELESTAHLPIPRQRYPWFLGAALGLLMGGMLMGDRKRERRGSWLALLALFMVSASPLEEVDDLVRRGNAAFAADDFTAALTYYEQAEERSTDPGLIAFNKAAALYRLAKYQEAEEHFLRCLEDGNAAPLRKARGYYDLGNCLLKQAGGKDAAILKRAMDSFRDSLSLNPGNAELNADARHNLELATLLWLKVRDPRKKDGDPNHTKDPEPRPPKNEKSPEEKGAKNGKSIDPKGKESDKTGKEPGPGDNQKKLAARAKLLNLPDQDELVPLPADDAAALLELTAQRILSERRQYRRQATPPVGNTKDW